MLADLRVAIRTLLKNPGFALSGVLILGLGCAAATTIFSVAYGVLLRDLPYDHPEQLVSLRARFGKAGLSKGNAGAADYYDWRQRQQVFEDLALTKAVGNFNLTGAGEPERLQGARATASLFRVLRVTPLLGRTFTEEEERDPNRAAGVAVLSYALWQRRFGGDPAILGRRIQLNGISTEVIGVMRPEFRYPRREFELWAPFYYPPDQLKTRQDFSYYSVARLRAGVTLGQARAQMETIAASLSREYVQNRDLGVNVAPLLGELTDAVRPALWVLSVAAGTLFLIGCVNLANLLLARATGRQREFAIRAAVGATRFRLARQCFVETLPLTLAGAAAGVLGASWLLEILIPMLPPGLPRVEEITIQTPVMVFTIILSIAAALGISLVPALQASAGIGRGPLAHGKMRDSLIVAEIACTVVLLVGAGLLMRSFVSVRATHPGFEADRVLSLHFAVDRARHGAEDREVAQYVSRLADRVRAVAGVESVGVVNRLPLSGQVQTLVVEFEGRSEAVNIDSRSIGGDYLRTLGIPVLAGRTFRADEVEGRPPVGMIDDRVARLVFGEVNPIGKRFRIPIPDQPWVEIVGVVGHIRTSDLESDPRPQVYWPYAQRAQDRVAMSVKTAGDPAAMTAAVRAALREVDPDQPLYDVRPMTEVVQRTLLAQRLNVLLVGAFAFLALVLAGTGLYGVIAQITARRAREFGIRLAIGAEPGHLARSVIRQALGRAAVGLAVGLAISAAVTRWIGSLIHGVGSLDPVTYLGVAGVLMGVVAAASYLPARRASRTDPAVVLRGE